MEVLQVDKARKDLGSPPSISPPVRNSISGRQYSCLVRDAGVQFSDEANDSTKYEANIDIYLPLLTPKLTKAGKIAVHQPHIPKKPVKWWRAQCGFRGLSVSRKLRDLQDRIREHGNGGLSKTMKEACEKMEKDYVMSNNRAIEAIWIRADNNERPSYGRGGYCMSPWWYTQDQVEKRSSWRWMIGARRLRTSPAK